MRASISIFRSCRRCSDRCSRCCIVLFSIVTSSSPRTSTQNNPSGLNNPFSPVLRTGIHPKPSTGSSPREPSSSRPSVFSPGARRPPVVRPFTVSSLLVSGAPQCPGESPGAPGVSSGPAGPALPQQFSLHRPSRSVAFASCLRPSCRFGDSLPITPDTRSRRVLSVHMPAHQRGHIGLLTEGDGGHPATAGSILPVQRPPRFTSHAPIHSLRPFSLHRQESDSLANPAWTCEPARPPGPTTPIPHPRLATLKSSSPVSGAPQCPGESPGAPGVSVDPAGSKSGPRRDRPDPSPKVTGDIPQARDQAGSNVLPCLKDSSLSPSSQSSKSMCCE